MKVNEILSDIDLANMSAKFMLSRELFSDAYSAQNCVYFTTKKDVTGSISVNGEDSYFMVIDGKNDDIDMGSFDSLSDIIEVIEDIESDPAAWFREYDSIDVDDYDTDAED